MGNKHDTKIVPMKFAAQIAPIEQYFAQFDSHCHSFSHCVRAYRSLSEWENASSVSLGDKLSFINQSIREIYSAAKKRNVLVQCITEHPQFRRYEIPFQKYIGVVNKARESYEKYFAKLPIGVEIEIKKDENKKFCLDLNEISDGEISPMDLLSQVDVVVGAVHSKHQKGAISDSEDYLSMLVGGAHALADLKTELEKEGGRNKVYVLGHPWDAAAEINMKEYDLLKKIHPEITELHNCVSAYELSDYAKISFLNHKQLNELSNALIECDIYPEINAHSVNIGKSDIRAASNGPKETIIENYIMACEKKHKKAIISIGSDSHKIDDIGNMSCSKIFARIPRLEKVVVWCEKYIK